MMPNSGPLPDHIATRPRPNRFKFQFSLFWLMVVVTVVAVVLGLVGSFGPVFGIVWYATLYLVRCLILTPMLICAIFGRGHIRAFAVGALVPWVMSFPWETQQVSTLVLILTLSY